MNSSETSVKLCTQANNMFPIPIDGCKHALIKIKQQFKMQPDKYMKQQQKQILSPSRYTIEHNKTIEVEKKQITIGNRIINRQFMTPSPNNYVIQFDKLANLPKLVHIPKYSKINIQNGVNKSYCDHDFYNIRYSNKQIKPTIKQKSLDPFQPKYQGTGEYYSIDNAKRLFNDLKIKNLNQSYRKSEKQYSIE